MSPDASLAEAERAAKRPYRAKTKCPNYDRGPSHCTCPYHHSDPDRACTYPQRLSRSLSSYRLSRSLSSRRGGLQRREAISRK